MQSGNQCVSNFIYLLKKEKNENNRIVSQNIKLLCVLALPSLHRDYYQRHRNAVNWLLFKKKKKQKKQRKRRVHENISYM